MVFLEGFCSVFWRIQILGGVKVSDLLRGATWVPTCTKYSEASV